MKVKFCCLIYLVGSYGDTRFNSASHENSVVSVFGPGLRFLRSLPSCCSRCFRNSSSPNGRPVLSCLRINSSCSSGMPPSRKRRQSLIISGRSDVRMRSAAVFFSGARERSARVLDQGRSSGRAASCAYRVWLHIARRSDEMRVVEREGGEDQNSGRQAGQRGRRC